MEQLIKGQRYKEFKIITNENDPFFHLFYVSDEFLEIFFLDLCFQNYKQIHNLKEIDIETEIYFPTDLETGSMGKINQDLFCCYNDAENKLKKLRQEKIIEINSGKK